MSARTVAAAKRPAQDPAGSDILGNALGGSLKQIGACLPSVLNRHDAEGLHQLRVALRRLNVALASFGRSAAQSELRARTKAFAAALAPAREYDVFLSELFDPVVAELGERTGFTLLRQRAETARETAWNTALAELKSPAFAQFRKDIAALPHLKPGPLKKAAPQLMEAHLKRVRKRGHSLKEMVPRDCHRLRIALKKLRYAAELVAPLYGKKRVKRYLDQVEVLQDLLGRLNDRAEVRSVLARLTLEKADATAEADVSFAVGLILGWHRAGSDRLTKKTQTCWARFKDAAPFWV